MQWFRDEFAKSNIISGALAIVIWGVICYLAVVQSPIPDLLTAAGMAVISFFLGAKQGVRSGYTEALHDIDREQGSR